MSARSLLLLVILAALIVVPLVHADAGPYLIPLEGSRWNRSVISVHVAGGKEWQRNQTYQAIQIWNQAQLSFARRYFPNSSVYTFEVGDSSAQVQVRLLNSTAVVGTIQAWTDYHALNGTMESASVKIGAKTSPLAVLLLSLHELGHVLGIGHVSCCKRDLMDPYPVTNSAWPTPTTLDLYAVHVLSSGDPSLSFVVLPNKIPYEPMPSEVALPESANLLIMLTAVSGVLLMRRRKLAA